MNVTQVGAICRPLAWGNEQHLRLVQEHVQNAGFDLILCSDVLWLRSAHPKLIATLKGLMNAQSRAIFVAGMHGGSGPIRSFLAEASQYGLVPDHDLPWGGLWERCATTREEKPWSSESDIEKEIDERGKFNCLCILRLHAHHDTTPIR